MKKVQLHLNYAGYCLADEHHAIRGGKRKKIKFHALWGLIRHPEQGYILYDTGYTSRFFTATRRFPNKIYALATQVVIEAQDEVVQQLARNGIAAAEIRHLIITHFHADHVAGVKDFPNATIYTSRVALEQFNRLRPGWSFTKGILKSLLPENLAERTQFMENVGTLQTDEIWGKTYDLFRDNSLMVIPLPGHAAGQIGLRLNTAKNTYFLVADACWLKRAYQEKALPHPIVRLFFDSWSDYKESLSRLHRFHQLQPAVIVVPTHCQTSTDPLVRDIIDWDAL